MDLKKKTIVLCLFSNRKKNEEEKNNQCVEISRESMERIIIGSFGLRFGEDRKGGQAT